MADDYSLFGDMGEDEEEAPVAVAPAHAADRRHPREDAAFAAWLTGLPAQISDADALTLCGGADQVPGYTPLWRQCVAALARAIEQPTGNPQTLCSLMTTLWNLLPTPEKIDPRHDPPLDALTLFPAVVEGMERHANDLMVQINGCMLLTCARTFIMWSLPDGPDISAVFQSFGGASGNNGPIPPRPPRVQRAEDAVLAALARHPQSMPLDLAVLELIWAWSESGQGCLVKHYAQFQPLFQRVLTDPAFSDQSKTQLTQSWNLIIEYLVDYGAADLLGSESILNVCLRPLYSAIQELGLRQPTKVLQFWEHIFLMGRTSGADDAFCMALRADARAWGAVELAMTDAFNRCEELSPRQWRGEEWLIYDVRRRVQLLFDDNLTQYVTKPVHSFRNDGRRR